MIRTSLLTIGMSALLTSTALSQQITIDFNEVDPASAVPVGIVFATPAAAYATWDANTVNAADIQATVANGDLSQAFGDIIADTKPATDNLLSAAAGGNVLVNPDKTVGNNVNVIDFSEPMAGKDAAVLLANLDYNSGAVLATSSGSVAIAANAVTGANLLVSGNEASSLAYGSATDNTIAGDASGLTPLALSGVPYSDITYDASDSFPELDSSANFLIASGQYNAGTITANTQDNNFSISANIVDFVDNGDPALDVRSALSISGNQATSLAQANVHNNTLNVAGADGENSYAIAAMQINRGAVSATTSGTNMAVTPGGTTGTIANSDVNISNNRNSASATGNTATNLLAGDYSQEGSGGGTVGLVTRTDGITPADFEEQIMTVGGDFIINNSQYNLDDPTDPIESARATTATVTGIGMGMDVASLVTGLIGDNVTINFRDNRTDAIATGNSATSAFDISQEDGGNSFVISDLQVNEQAITATVSDVDMLVRTPGTVGANLDINFTENLYIASATGNTAANSFAMQSIGEGSTQLIDTLQENKGTITSLLTGVRMGVNSSDTAAPIGTNASIAFRGNRLESTATANINSNLIDTETAADGNTVETLAVQNNSGDVLAETFDNITARFIDMETTLADDLSNGGEINYSDNEVMVLGRGNVQENGILTEYSSGNSYTITATQINVGTITANMRGMNWSTSLGGDLGDALSDGASISYIDNMFESTAIANFQINRIGTDVGADLDAYLIDVSQDNSGAVLANSEDNLMKADVGGDVVASSGISFSQNRSESRAVANEQYNTIDVDSLSDTSSSGITSPQANSAEVTANSKGIDWSTSITGSLGTDSGDGADIAYTGNTMEAEAIANLQVNQVMVDNVGDDVSFLIEADQSNSASILADMNESDGLVRNSMAVSVDSLEEGSAVTFSDNQIVSRAVGNEQANAIAIDYAGVSNSFAVTSDQTNTADAIVANSNLSDMAVEISGNVDSSNSISFTGNILSATSIANTQSNQIYTANAVSTAGMNVYIESNQSNTANVDANVLSNELYVEIGGNLDGGSVRYDANSIIAWAGGNDQTNQIMTETGVEASKFTIGPDDPATNTMVQNNTGIITANLQDLEMNTSITTNLSNGASVSYMNNNAGANAFANNQSNLIVIGFGSADTARLIETSQTNSGAVTANFNSNSSGNLLNTDVGVELGEGTNVDYRANTLFASGVGNQRTDRISVDNAANSESFEIAALQTNSGEITSNFDGLNMSTSAGDGSTTGVINGSVNYVGNTFYSTAGGNNKFSQIDTQFNASQNTYGMTATQTNIGAITATLNGIDMSTSAASGSGSDSSVRYQDNVLMATAYGNSQTNYLTQNSAGLESQYTMSSYQTNQANVSATASNINMSINLTNSTSSPISAGRTRMSGNRITATAVGNSSVNVMNTMR